MGYLIRYMELENLPSLRANKICYFPKDDKVVKTNKYSFSLFLYYKFTVNDSYGL